MLEFREAMSDYVHAPVEIPASLMDDLNKLGSFFDVTKETAELGHSAVSKLGEERQRTGFQSDHPLVRGPAQGGDIGRRRGASRQPDVAQELRADLRGGKIVLGKPPRRAAVTLIITVDRLDGGEGLVLV